MNVYTYYNTETGLFSGRRSFCPPGIQPDPAEGFAFLEGDYDHRTKRVDLETLEVIDR